LKKDKKLGRLLLSFKPGAKSFILKGKIKQLQGLFLEDNYLQDQVNQLTTCLETSPENSETQDNLIRSIRTQISETYRLHRRMLRNRRETVEDVIFQRNLLPQEEYGLDERSPMIYELLDEWRINAPQTENYQKIFKLLFLASNTWLGILKQILEIRLNIHSKEQEISLIQDFDQVSIETLKTTPYFSGEEELLKAIINQINTPSEDGDQLELLKIMLLYHLANILGLQGYCRDLNKLLDFIQNRIERPLSSDKFPKIIIFTCFQQTAQKLIKFLSQTFGKIAVTSHLSNQSREQIENNLQQFQTVQNCFLLVCDSSGEEGINLQFADGLIHFDLPFSPNRLEQRLGRLDRIGGKIQIKSWILLGLENTPQEVFYHILKRGFKIFDNSIASLQFYVDSKLPELERLLFNDNLFANNSEQINQLIQTIETEIEQEKLKINEQNALDEIEINTEHSNQYFQELDDYDANHKAIKAAIGGILGQALQFKFISDPNIPEVYQYDYSFSGKHPTLIPLDQLRQYFLPILRQSGTYNRRIANQNPGIKLYRLGENLIDTLAEYVDWDDRGQAFAMWRYHQEWDQNEGSEWLGFRFDYIIETDFSLIKKVASEFNSNHLNLEALQRQADGLFPPQFQTIFLDINLEIVTNESLLNILQLPYTDTGETRRDYNLAKKRLPILDQFIDPYQWPNLCREARQTSEQLLRNNPQFQEICQQYLKIAINKLENRLHQLELRHYLLSKNNNMNTNLSLELPLEKALKDALIQGIKTPRIHPDSVGFIIVSGRKLSL
jgi:ATP-dependent helicase HepA